MPTGKVKWFNDAKGYGFIAQDTGEEVFVHFAHIESRGFRTLTEGEIVEYELMPGDRGLIADHVVRR